MSDQPVRAEDMPETLLRADLAKLLRMSLRTLDELRAKHANLPPQMVSLDDRPRWAKSTVLAWMAQTDVASRWRMARGGR